MLMRTAQLQNWNIINNTYYKILRYLVYKTRFLAFTIGSFSVLKNIKDLELNQSKKLRTYTGLQKTQSGFFYVNQQMFLVHLLFNT